MRDNSLRGAKVVPRPGRAPSGARFPVLTVPKWPRRADRLWPPWGVAALYARRLLIGGEPEVIDSRPGGGGPRPVGINKKWTLIK